MKKQTLLTALSILMIFSSPFISHSIAQGHISLSGGPDFATFQILKDGKTSPLYSDDNLKIGIAIPYSFTANYTYGKFQSLIVEQDEPLQANIMFTVAGGGYLGYEFSETFKVGAILGFGTIVNSQPFNASFTPDGDLTNEFLDFMGTGIYVDLQGRYEKFGLKFTSFSDLFQVFATYHVTEKFFVGIGARRLNRIFVTKGNNVVPEKPSVLQATLGLTLGK